MVLKANFCFTKWWKTGPRWTSVQISPMWMKTSDLAHEYSWGMGTEKEDMLEIGGSQVERERVGGNGGCGLWRRREVVVVVAMWVMGVDGARGKGQSRLTSDFSDYTFVRMWNDYRDYFVRKFTWARKTYLTKKLKLVRRFTPTTLHSSYIVHSWMQPGHGSISNMVRKLASDM